MIKVIGIDPGLADTGIGIVKGSGLKVNAYSFGCIRTSKHDKMPYRLEHIYSKVLTLLEHEKPDYVVVEDIFSLGRYPRSGIILGKVSGVILLAGQKAGIPVIEIAVREAKKILTGNGRAGKVQLEESVRAALRHATRIRPDHASDALALSLIGLYRSSGSDMLLRGKRDRL
ncbi:MAG: crossover junction endodeoxyribonuclease RuvC [Desulfobacterales bacterium]|nr:crossover junction endodeoxyribonuclease RuvC [Desulfobacterales bacterium]